MPYDPAVFGPISFHTLMAFMVNVDRYSKVVAPLPHLCRTSKLGCGGIICHIVCLLGVFSNGVV